MSRDTRESIDKVDTPYLRTLKAFYDYYEEHNSVAPSIRDLQGILEYASPSTVWAYLDRAVKRGHMTRIDGKGGSYRLTKRGRRFIAQSLALIELVETSAGLYGE